MSMGDCLPAGFLVGKKCDWIGGLVSSVSEAG